MLFVPPAMMTSSPKIKNKDSLYLPQLSHLLGIEKLSPQDINFIIKKSQEWFEKNKNKPQKTDILRGKTQINLFFETIKLSAK